MKLIEAAAGSVRPAETQANDLPRINADERGSEQQTRFLLQIPLASALVRGKFFSVSCFSTQHRIHRRRHDQ